MKDRMFLVQHNGKLYGFATDKTKEMLDFSLKKLGGKFSKNTKVKAGKIIDNPESMWRLEADQPYVELTGEDGGYVNVFLIHDGLKVE